MMFVVIYTVNEKDIHGRLIPHWKELCVVITWYVNLKLKKSSLKVAILFQWCKGGRCISRGFPVSAAYSSTSQTSQSRIEKSSGIWAKWKPFSDCASGCLFGEEGRLRSGSTGIKISTRICNNPR
jgi:hypothetical protein